MKQRPTEDIIGLVLYWSSTAAGPALKNSVYPGDNLLERTKFSFVSGF